MRISKPKDWAFMSDEAKEEWTIKTGREITQARDTLRDIARQMSEKTEYKIKESEEKSKA